MEKLDSWITCQCIHCLKQKSNFFMRSNVFNYYNIFLTGVFASWMKFIDPERTLQDLIIPGSHQSATYSIKDNFMLGIPNLIGRIAKNQEIPIIYQLYMGFRYFDFRIKIDQGKVINHHSFINAKCMESILKEEIALFIENFPSEILILDFQTVTQKAKAPLLNLISKYLSPEKIAGHHYDFSLSLKNLRSLGKRYFIIWRGHIDDGDPQFLLQRNEFLSSPYEEDIYQSSEERIINFLKETTEKSYYSNKLVVSQMIKTIKPSDAFYKNTKTIAKSSFKHFFDYLKSDFAFKNMNIFIVDYCNYAISFVGQAMIINKNRGFFSDDTPDDYFKIADSISYFPLRDKFNIKNISVKFCNVLFLLGFENFGDSETFIDRTVSMKPGSYHEFLFKLPDNYVISFIYIENTARNEDFYLRIKEGWIFSHKMNIFIKPKSVQNIFIKIKISKVCNITKLI